MIVFPGNTFFEFLAGEDQYFDISCNINDPAGTLVFRGSDENERFLEYQKKWKSLQEEAMAAGGKLESASPSGSESAALRKQLSDQEKKMKQYLHETADKNKGTLLGAIAMVNYPCRNNNPRCSGRHGTIRIPYHGYGPTCITRTISLTTLIFRSPDLSGARYLEESLNSSSGRW